MEKGKGKVGQNALWNQRIGKDETFSFPSTFFLSPSSTPSNPCQVLGWYRDWDKQTPIQWWKDCII